MANPNITAVHENTFDSEVKNSNTLVLADFYADWCGPCKQIAPILDEIAEEMKGKIKIVKIDVDEDPKLAETYGVRGIPTLIIFKAGDIQKTMVGLQSKEKLLDAINGAM